MKGQIELRQSSPVLMATEDRAGQGAPCDMSATESQILTEGKVVPQFQQRGLEPRDQCWKAKRESQTQADAFSYDQLNGWRHEIRLCILDPGAIDDPLTCALRTVSLMEHPVYETLSYAWGDPALNNKIVANGRVIKITKNLHTALRYLRKSDEPRVIWADGICINQSDLKERSSQVGMMGDVFQRGKELQIWLGEAEEIESEFRRSTPLEDYWCLRNDAKFFTHFLQSQNLMKTLPPVAFTENPSLQASISSAIRTLWHLATGRHLYQMPFFKVTGPDTIEPCPTWAASLRVLSIILSRPWWARVWIVQEVVLSTQATVHIGGYKVPLSLILDAMTSSQKHALDCCGSWDLLWERYREIHVSILDSRKKIIGLADLIDLQASGITLMDALIISATREASDPRDHVYALQGLLKKDFAVLKPTYQISTQKVYSSATKMLFSEATGLDNLRFAVGTQSSNAHGLASWVCDWSRKLNPILLRPHLFNSSNVKIFRTKQTADGILTVEGCKIDMICTTGITVAQDGLLRERLECLEAWWSLAGFEKSNEKSTFWTTIFFGSFDPEGGDGRRMLPEDLVAVEAWWKWAKSLVEQGDYNAQIPVEDQKIRVINTHISYLMPSSKLWLTSEGFLGLGRPTVEKGDEVFIVKGSRVPLILRPIETTLLPKFGLSEHEQGFLFVSDCYLHGFMDGEAVKSDTKWQRVHLC